MFYTNRQRYMDDGGGSSMLSGMSRGNLSSLRYNGGGDIKYHQPNSSTTRIRSYNVDNISVIANKKNTLIGEQILSKMRHIFDDLTKDVDAASRGETGRCIKCEERTYIVLDVVKGAKWRRSFRDCKELKRFKHLNLELGIYKNIREDTKETAIIMKDYYRGNMRVRVRTHGQILTVIILCFIFVVLVIFYRPIHNAILNIT